MRTAVATGPGQDDLAGPRTWSAHAAAVWAFAFAAISFFSAAGGVLGRGALAEAAVASFGRDWSVALCWLTGGLAAAAGMLALALVRPWSARIPWRLLLVATAVVGGLLAGYPLLDLGARGVQALAVPGSTHIPVAWWQLLLWTTWFLAGGVLFLLAAWHGRGGRVGAR